MTGLQEGQSRSITVEISVQNVALAIVLAITFFEDRSYVAVPVAYLILMYVFVPLFIASCRIRDARSDGTDRGCA
jgi:predicted Na+-dependent transporter